MTVSSSQASAPTRNEIIERAMQIAGIRGLEQSAPVGSYSFANQLLNFLLDHWDTQLHIWCLNRSFLILDQYVNTYRLGTTARFVSSYIPTSTTATSLSGIATLVVSSVTGMTVGDTLGVIRTDGTRQWQTISSINTGTLTITLNAVLTANVDINAIVITYHASDLLTDRPREVLNMQSRVVTAPDSNNISQNSDIEMTMVSRDRYFNTAVKQTTSSTIRQFYYDPRRDTYGNLYMYPTPQDNGTVLCFDYIRSLYDFMAADDTPDLPSEWSMALVWNLALLLCPGAGKDDKMPGISTLADKYFKEVKAYDTDKASILIQPNTGQ